MADEPGFVAHPGHAFENRDLTPAGGGALATGGVVLAGALCLALPFWGDQALFTVYARQLTEGAVLYRDIFDVKQPGIFLFYLAGGLLFGFTEVGIHLFELGYWVAFCIFAIIALRPYFTRRWSAPLVPIFTVAAYYLHANLLDLTQIEMLVGFPLLVAWWLIDRADPGTARALRRHAAAGLAAAIVVLLKHLYLLIVLAFLGYAALRAWRRGTRVAAMRGALVAFTLGLAAPLAAVAAYFVAHGQVDRIWWAYFEMAPAAQLLTPRPIEYLVSGARRFLIGHGPLLILAVLGCAHALRRATPSSQSSRPGSRGPHAGTPATIHCDGTLIIGMVLWLLAAFVAFIVLQGWPEYKWTIFTVPLGILAVCGAEALAVRIGSLERAALRLTLGGGVLLCGAAFILAAPVPQLQTRLLAAVAIGVCAAAGIELLDLGRRARQVVLQAVVVTLAFSIGLAAIAPAGKLRMLAAHGFALTPEARTSFQRTVNHAYRTADEDLALLRTNRGAPDSLYVFGDPVLLLRANLPQPVPILGWGPEFLDARAWRQLHADLIAAPPQYMVIEEHIEPMVRERYPALPDWIATRYTLAFTGASGTWYERR